MGFDNECIINIQSLKGEYFCPVCRLLVYPNEAIQAQCSHLYCKPCLTYVVRTTQACPYDGYLVTEADSKPLLESNKALADTIGKISVHCLFHRSGCTWQGQLSDCTNHCSSCAFGNSPVVCNRCGVQLVHSQVQEHAQTCSGAQTQAQQPENGQVASGTTAIAPSTQNQTVAPTATPASQAQTSQAPVATPAVQNSTQQVNPATQVHSAQAAIPNSEQWYQQQQQYQQYYQQYPGYDPYQQYQQYYPYQQYQQPAQQPTTQIPGQHQPNPQSQFQTQQQVQASQTPQQPQQPSQAPPTAQQQAHPSQATTNIQQQIPPAAQPQTLHNPVAYSAPHSQPQAYSQVQPSAYPQTMTQGAPQQGMQMPQYQQTTSQMQPTHPQVLTQPYPQAHSHQAHHYPHPQSHMPPQTQTHPRPNNQTIVQPPPHANQPINNATQPRPQQSSAQAVTGYHSYPQPQPQQQPPQQAQVGPPHASHMTASHQQPLNPGQVQGQFSQKPPHAPIMMPNQQPSMVPSTVQHPGAPVAQVPVYPHPQHPGYPVQPHSGMQPAQHPSIQPQGFPGQGPYLQLRPVMQAPVRAQTPSQVYQQKNVQASFPNAAQNYPIRPPMISHGGVQQPYSQAHGLANAGHMLQPQLSTNQPSGNQSNPSAAYKIGAQNMDKGKQEQNNGNAGNLGSMGSQSVEMKKATFEDNKKGLSDSNPRFENGALQDGNLKIKEEAVDSSTEQLSATKSADVANKDHKENEPCNVQLSDKAFGAGAPTSVSSLPPPQFATQVPGSAPSDMGRNQLPLVHQGPSSQKRPAGPSLPHSIPVSGASQFLGQPPGQLRPQVPAQMHPSSQPFGMHDNAQLQFHNPGAVHPENLSAGMAAPYGRRPGSMGLPQGHFDQGKFPGGPPHPQPPNPMERLAFSDGRQPELHPLGPMERGPFGKPSSLHGLQDDRLKMMPEEHLKPFATDRNFDHRDFEGDLKKFSRPSHLDDGTSAKFGSRFPPPGPLDQSPHMFGDRMKPVGFHDVTQGRPDYPDFMRPGPEFGHRGMDSLTARSPGRDFRGVPNRGFGGFPGGIDGNESNSYPLEKVIHENRVPGVPGRLQRGEYGQDMLLGHSRRGEHFGLHNIHSGEAPGLGAFGGRLEMGEPPFPGGFLPPRPFGEAFGPPHHPDPGFRSGFHLQRYADEAGFYRGEMELFHNSRKRKPGSIMCRICNVDCETLEGLDLHSQTRDHQKKAMDMVLSIKQNSKKQKVSNDRSSFEEGRKPRASGFDGRGRKR